MFFTVSINVSQLCYKEYQEIYCVQGEKTAGAEFKNVPSAGLGIQKKSLE
jgi:hypothetical protein